MKHTTLRLPDAEYEAIATIAAANERATAAEIRLAIRAWIAGHKPKGEGSR